MFSLNPLDNIFPGGTGGALSILIFHRVMDNADPLAPGEITKDQFFWQMQLLAKTFNVVSLQQGLNDLFEGTLSPRSIAITFDDGYADNYSLALPILEQFGLHATFFIATGFLVGGIMWNDVILECVRSCSRQSVSLDHIGFGGFSLQHPIDRLSAVKVLQNGFKYMTMEERAEKLPLLEREFEVDSLPALMMTPEQVCDLHKRGMAVGGHTRNHPILSVEADQITLKEIEDGIKDLEKIVDSKIELFAYPNGKPGVDFGDAHVEMLRKIDIKFAFTTANGAAKTSSDPLRMPRFTPWDRSAIKYIIRLAMNARGN